MIDRCLIGLLALGFVTGDARSSQAGPVEIVIRAEKLATALDEDGRERDVREPARDARADITRLASLAPQLETHCARHPRDARALVALARIRYLQIEFETVGAKTGAPSIREDQTGLDPVIPLLDSAAVLEPRLASAWFWKARLLSHPTMYLKAHRMESMSWMNPDYNRALPPCARAVELEPEQQLHRDLFALLLRESGRTEEDYRAHPLVDRPWGPDGSLARLEEELSQVPVPQGSVLLGSTDLEGQASSDPGSGERGVLRTREYAVPASASDLERHFATTWPGFVWKEVKAEDLEGDPFGELFAGALTDTTNGRVRMFTSTLEWSSEEGGEHLRLPWGEGPEAVEGIYLIATELTGKAGGNREGPLVSIRSDPYCLLKLINRRTLSR